MGFRGVQGMGEGISGGLWWPVETLQNTFYTAYNS